MLKLCFVIFLLSSVPNAVQATIKARLVIGDQVLHKINPSSFLNVALDGSIIRGNWCEINWA